MNSIIGRFSPNHKHDHTFAAVIVALTILFSVSYPLFALGDKPPDQQSDAVFVAKSKSTVLAPLSWTNTPSPKPPKFYYPNPMRPYMRRLNETYQIAKMTEDASSDLERVRIVCEWVNQQWKHHGDCAKQKNDPIAILEAARTGDTFSCYEYSLVTSGCLNSIGIRSRTVVLLPKDVERRPEGNYHVVTEAYLNDRKKWVMVDAQWNAIPVLNNYPLSIVELQNAVAKNMGGINLGSVKNGMDNIYLSSIPLYVHFLYTPLDNRVVGANSPENLTGGVLLVPIGEKPPASYASAPVYGKITVINSIPDFYGQAQP